MSISPYLEAFKWIQANSAGSLGLAKLLVTLWRPTIAISFGECTNDLDEERTALAQRVVVHYGTVGADRELEEIGAALAVRFPQLLERDHLPNGRSSAVFRGVSLPAPAGSVRREYTVASEADADELDEAWRAIVHGRQRPRTEARAEDLDQVQERARVGLARITQALRDHPGTGQGGRLVKFLLGLYNGDSYRFDLTDLRALDTELANACLDYLAYDTLGKREVHHHIDGGDRQLNHWRVAYGLHPTAQLPAELARRLFVLTMRDDELPNQNDLIVRAIEPLVAQQEARRYACIVSESDAARGHDKHGDPPAVHAWRHNVRPAVVDGQVLPNVSFGEPVQPLCGAAGGPKWRIDRSYSFGRIDCPDCLTVMLDVTFPG